MSDDLWRTTRKFAVYLWCAVLLEFVVFGGEGPLSVMFATTELLAETTVSAPASIVSTAGTALLPVAGLLLAVLGATFAGVVALALGAEYLQRVRESPYSPRAFGVRGRSLQPEEVELGDHDAASCLKCGREDGPGVRRGYVEEVVLAGVPVRVEGRSETYDCAAHTDADGLDALDSEDRDPLDLALDLASEDADKRASASTASVDE